jgi:hypothetical protein
MKSEGMKSDFKSFAESYTQPMFASEIESALGVLIDLPLWAVGRAVDLAWFEFGTRRSVRGFKGVEKEVGDYALHIQCAGRITRDDRVVLGRGDIFCTPNESDELSPPDFDWQKGNRFDRVAKDFLGTKSHQLSVLTVRGGEAGSVRIELERGHVLEIFPQDSESGEHWRFFKPFTKEPHFVFSGKGLRQE